jgi:DNA-binding transcriptional regulator LsrR (DeoR family)
MSEKKVDDARERHMLGRSHTDPATLRQVAKWYYKDHLTKTEIANRLKLPNPNNQRPVNKMLEDAERLKIVRIDIPETVLDCGPAYELQQIYPHLQEIITVPSHEDEEYSALLPRWGAAAAAYFDKLVAQEEEVHIGLSGGETLFEFCEAVTTQRRENVHVHTTGLVGRGRLRPRAAHVDPIVNATVLWAKCGRISGHCHYATVPPYGGLNRDEIRAEVDSLSKREPIRQIIEDMDKINVVFASIGTVMPKVPEGDPDNLTPKLTITGLLEPTITPEQLAEEGAIGDFSGSFFDKKCNGNEKWQFFLTAGYYDPSRHGLEFFRQMVNERHAKKVILVAGGDYKVEAIKIALRGELCNVWITDYNSLLSVLTR